MQLSTSEENMIDRITQLLERTSWILVIFTFLAIPIFIFLMLFVDIKDSEISAWCEEYHPTWTYEQCESMTGY